MQNLFFQVTSFGVFFCRTKTKESFISLNNEVTEALLGGAGQSSMSKLLLLCCSFPQTVIAQTNFIIEQYLAFSLWRQREAKSKFAFCILISDYNCILHPSTSTVRNLRLCCK